jgi:hypothetical protein
MEIRMNQRVLEEKAEMERMEMNKVENKRFDSCTTQGSVTICN